MSYHRPIEQQLEDALASTSLGLSFVRLRRRLGYEVRLSSIAIALEHQAEEKHFVLNHQVYWALPEDSPHPSPDHSLEVHTGESTDGPPVIGNPALIGPVWEPEFAHRLWRNGLEIIQQYPAEGYYLDIALVTNDGRVRLDIEVDGRTTHCDRFGRRKVDDIVRDARLASVGWFIKRFWVSELMRDMDGCVEQVHACWRQLVKKESKHE